MEWFDIAELAARPSIDGETHLHESAFACTSLFVYPNGNGLRGIAPHYHTHCDDIEVILKGEIAIFGMPGSATLIPAHYLVVNPAGSAHGYFVHADEVIVLGVRTPKSYDGVSLLDRWRGQSSSMSATCTPLLIDTANYKVPEYVNTHVEIRVHRIDAAAECLLHANDSETILLALGPVVIVQVDVGSHFHLPMLGLAVYPGDATLRCWAASATTLIEIRPVGPTHSIAAAMEWDSRHV